MIKKTTKRGKNRFTPNNTRKLGRKNKESNTDTVKKRIPHQWISCNFFENDDFLSFSVPTFGSPNVLNTEKMNIFINTKTKDSEELVRFTKLPQHFNEEEILANEKDACIICYERKSSVALVPCGHSSFCFSCIKHMSESNLVIKCPNCKKEADTVIRIFK